MRKQAEINFNGRGYWLALRIWQKNDRTIGGDLQCKNENEAIKLKKLFLHDLSSETFVYSLERGIIPTDRLKKHEAWKPLITIAKPY